MAQTHGFNPDPSHEHPESQPPCLDPLLAVVIIGGELPLAAPLSEDAKAPLQSALPPAREKFKPGTAPRPPPRGLQSRLPSGLRGPSAATATPRLGSSLVRFALQLTIKREKDRDCAKGGDGQVITALLHAA